MSVWKKIKSEVLKENVSKEMFIRSLQEMGIGVDESIKTIKNGFGTDTCDAALVKDGRVTSMGIKYTQEGGIELVGDIWATGLGRDKGQEELMDRMAHTYQVNNVKEQLQYTNWYIEGERKEKGKTILELVQY